MLKENTLLFYQIEPLKNGVSLILPSSTLAKKMNFWNPVRDSWGPHYQGTAIPALSENLPKWHFLIRAWNLKIFWAKWLHLRCHSLTFSKKCLRLRPASSKCLSERINWIISRIPHRISKILFVYGSYEFLAKLEGKIREAPFFEGSIW